jgi:hypothetical protein
MPYGKKSMGKASPSKAYREPGKTDYGSSANVRESTSKTFSKPKKSKSKAGAYASYS